MLARPLQKVRSVNSNAASFTAPVCEIDLSMTDAGTAAGRSVVPTGLQPGGNGYVPNRLLLHPYGLGNNNDAFTMRVLGWRRVLPLGASEQRKFFVPVILADVLCTMGNFTGLAGFPVLNTEFFCDTVAKSIEPLKTGNTTLLDGLVVYYSPANDTPGCVLIPLQGVEAFEVQFDQTTNTPTMNALYNFIDE